MLALLVLVLGLTKAHAVPFFKTASGKAPVVLLSDPHFDPFRDPAKVPALQAAPVSGWLRILDEPASPTQAADYEKLQKTCHARGVDSSWELMRATLDAAHKQQPSPAFVTVTGDLLTHNFECRMRTLVPGATAKDLSNFSTKAVAFLALRFRAAFPDRPVYLTLGNNDSGCANYHQTPHSEFVEGIIQPFTASVFNHDSRTDSQEMFVPDFDDEGDYNVLLPAPMRRTRLMVLEDVFQSSEYKTCDGVATSDPATAQLRWLRVQLEAARGNKEHVWVLAHIPPGVDAYASFHKFVASPAKLCSTTATVPMLSSDKLSALLAEFSDVVSLALFAHTHMDEFKLIHDSANHLVAAKLVPSISPVNGNHPSFLVGEVQTDNGTLLDYTAYTATDLKGGSWEKAYRFGEVYNLPDYSATSAAKLSAALSGDKAGDTDWSHSYQHWFFPGDNGDYARDLRKIWPSYACGVAEDGGPAFHACMCPAGEAESGTQQ